MSDVDTEPTAMQEAASGCAKLFGYGVVGMGLIFADIAFLILIGNAFGSNPVFQVGAFLGAFTTSISVFGLLIGKARWFRPGPQLLAAYGFTVLEGLVMGMNVALCYAIYRHTDSNIVFQVWQMICPWTPLIAGAGWVVLFQLDPKQQRVHRIQEQQDKQHKAEVEYDDLIFQTRMKVKKTAVTMLRTELEQAIVSPERQLAIQQTASALADSILSEMSGKHITSSYVPRQIVQGSGHSVPSPALPVPTPNQQTAQVTSQSQEQKKPSIFGKIGQGIANFVNADTPPLFPTPVPPPSTPVQPVTQEQPAEQERVFTLDELKTALGQAYDRGHQDAQPVDTFRKLYEDYKSDPSLRATIGFDTYLEQVEKAKKVNSPLAQPQMDTTQASQAGGNHKN